MKTKIFFCLVLVFLISNNSIHAQKKKTDVEIIDFGEGSSTKSKKPIKYNNSIIKTNPFSIVEGRTFVEYEREVNDWFSVQAGLGLTFQPLIESSSLLSIINDFESDGNFYCDSELWVNDVCDNHQLTNKDIRIGQLGYLANASLRLFPASDGFEGGYFSLVGGYTHYRFKARKVNEVRNNEIYEEDYTTAENVSYLDAVVRYGFQSLYPKLSTEYFIGVGLRKKISNLTDIGRDGGLVYRNGLVNYSSTDFIFQLGVRIGFQL
jgi:hypothetical protein